MFKALATTLIASGILIASYFTLLNFFPSIEHYQFFVFVAFFAALQFISTLAFERFNTDNDASKFVMTFLVATGVKFILSLFIILFLVTQFPEQKRVLALSFCLQYLFFLAIDSLTLLSKIRHRK